MSSSIVEVRRMTRMTRTRCRLVLSALTIASLAACANPTVPDLNNSSVSDFQAAPTGATANALSIGLIRGARDNTANVVQTLGIFGREGYEMSNSRGDLPLYITGPLVPGTFYVLQMWQGQYADLRASNIILDNLGNVPDLTATQKEAMRGFVQTMEAFDLTQLAATRDTFGLPISVDIPATGPPAPIVSKALVYQHIYNLLDSAQTHLLAGGPAFSFTLPAGFVNFSTPASFLTLNRALRARVDLLLSDYTDALTDLGGSFLSTTAPLTYGASFDFSNNTGDETNPIFQPYFYAETTLVTFAQHRGDGSLDLRVQTKLDSVMSFSFAGITSNLQFTIYTSTVAPLSMIRNEELILMRAEANLGLGQNTAALTDINFIRETSGGLPATTLTAASPPADLLAELLYNKRYSLMWEGGHSWIDYRQYGLLGTLPEQFAAEKFFPIVPFPLAECQGQSGSPSGCGTVTGF
jgi:starch-binding outer membrane protein, SusD/RagB family